MKELKERVRDDSLDFENQRRVVLLRDQGMRWKDIAERVRRIDGEKPSRQLLWTTYMKLDRKRGCRRYFYHRCGRKAWTVSAAIKK